MAPPVFSAPSRAALYPKDSRTGAKLLALFLLTSVSGLSQLLVDTVAGGKIRTGVPARQVSLTQLGGITYDAAGNLVLCDQTANVIRRVRPDGIIETLAGNGATGFSGDGGPALNAALNGPAHPRFDAQGNLYFADQSNLRIRRIDTKGTITTIAGTGVPYQAGMDLDGPALARSITNVMDLAVDPAGNVYFTAGYAADVIRRVTTSGRIEVFAGVPHLDCYSCTDGDGGPARDARIQPGSLAADARGNLYLSESTQGADYTPATHIRRIGPNGIITRYAGYGPAPALNTTPDDEAKPALDIYIYAISTMSVDPSGNLYFVQAARPGRQSTPLRIRRIDTNGIVKTIAGGPVTSASPEGPPLETAATPGTIAAGPGGLVAFTGTLPYPITSGAVIREVTPSVIRTIAGDAPRPAPDGTPARDAWFLNPNAIAINRSGELFVAETDACLIRKIGANGLLATAAGTGKCGSSSPGTPNTTPDLAYPVAVGADRQGRIYFVDNAGYSYVIAADGKISSTGLPPSLISGKIAVDAKDRVYSMSTFSLVRTGSDGKPQTIVAMPSQPGVPPPGFGPTSLGGLGVDDAGTVYFTGTYLGASTDYVFRVNDDGTITPIYGSAANPLHLGGFLRSLALDANRTVWFGNAFVNDAGQFSLGNSYGGYSGDGGPAQAARYSASFSVFAPNGDLYLLDGGRIRRVTGFGRTPKPSLNSGGVLNALSFTGGALAPGELISLFGLFDLSPAGIQVNVPENNRLPWQMGRTKVLFDGYPGAIHSMGPTQINVFVPTWLQSGASTTVTVQVDDVVSAPVQVPIAAAAPGFSPLLLNQDASLNSEVNGATRGSIVTLFGTGEGRVSPQLIWGDFSISTPYSQPEAAVSATIGGQPAEILYAGAAPLLPIGVFQVNVRIPGGLSAGSLPAVISVGGITSKPVSVWVR